MNLRILLPSLCFADAVAQACFGLGVDSPKEGRFSWEASAPLVAPLTGAVEEYYSVKDPTLVRHDGRWHLFATVRGRQPSHRIEYLSFSDWDRAASAERHFLQITNGYYCAPQVFFFSPHNKWYLIYQASDTNRPVALQPAFSTAKSIADWKSWSSPQLLFEKHPTNIKGWIDFWVICDATRAHLFFTSNNGLMWRSETTLGRFPFGWSEPVVVLKDDIFEASHTYKLAGKTQYLTVIEAMRNGRRYFKAYLADRLDDSWKPLAATWEQSFASSENVRFNGKPWAESISHGELIRTGIDEKLEIDLADLQFVFQGALDSEMRERKYGEIPWRLGILKSVRP